jgi:hypothetical protein
MSEINSIANGSFVLGQTSATNFIAGPGISITQPSEGTVRIANDETMLFSSDNGTSAGQLSESRKNFSRLKLEVGVQNQTTMQDGVTYFDISNRYDYAWIQYGMGAGGPNAYWINAKLNWTDDTHFEVNYASTIMKSQTATAVSGPTAYNNTTRNCIYQIIGINRISGGNE